MNTKLYEWCVTEDINTVIYKLNKEYTLYVSRIEGGITIKVIYNDEESLKPLVMFSQYFSDSKIGFSFLEKNF